MINDLSVHICNSYGEGTKVVPLKGPAPQARNYGSPGRKAWVALRK